MTTLRTPVPPEQVAEFVAPVHREAAGAGPAASASTSRPHIIDVHVDVTTSSAPMSREQAAMFVANIQNNPVAIWTWMMRADVPYVEMMRSPSRFTVVSRAGADGEVFSVTSGLIRPLLQQPPFLSGTLMRVATHFESGLTENDLDILFGPADNAPPERPALSQADLDKLPRPLELDGENAAHAAYLAETCVICLDTLEAGAVVRVLACNHAFHHACIDKWLVKNPICPTDRRSVLGSP